MLYFLNRFFVSGSRRLIREDEGEGLYESREEQYAKCQDEHIGGQSECIAEELTIVCLCVGQCQDDG